MGKVSQVLRIYLLSVSVYLGLFYLLTPALGLTGPGLAAITGSLLILLLMLPLVRKHQDT
jgi:O-antigen/teichoic acid export membrane protein